MELVLVGRPGSGKSAVGRRIAHARVGEEGQEGVRAFLARRKPGWAVV